MGEILGYSVYHLLGGGWWVVGGSRSGGRRRAVRAAEGGGVNLLAPRPTTAGLATAGLDSDVKIWAPTNPEPPAQLPMRVKKVYFEPFLVCESLD